MKSFHKQSFHYNQSVDYFNFNDNRLKFVKIDHLKLFWKYCLSESVLLLECTSCKRLQETVNYPFQSVKLTETYQGG